MDKLRVLAIDDEPGMRRGVFKTLTRFDMLQRDLNVKVEFEVTEAATGREGLEALGKGGFDIVLLDYKLPDIDGLHILNVIREKEYDVLTVMMTAYASLEVAVSATKNGAFDFLAKPFTPDELKAVVRKASSNLLLRRHARMLDEEKRQVRFQFLSVLSHELKSPLNAIQGYLNIMDTRVAGDNIVDYDKMIKRSLSRIQGMRKLIFDMLDLTRIESGQKKRELREINVREAAVRAIEGIEAMAANKKVTVELIPKDSVMMTGDDGELEIVFNNLISNAVKYNNDGGCVDVSIERAGDTVTISVSDTGIGMSEDEQARLFKEFVRFKNEKTRDIEGSGLGLSILKRISLLYNGEIKVESVKDKGTTFIMTLKDGMQSGNEAKSTG